MTKTEHRPYVSFLPICELVHSFRNLRRLVSPAHLTTSPSLVADLFGQEVTPITSSFEARLRVLAAGEAQVQPIVRDPVDVALAVYGEVRVV